MAIRLIRNDNAKWTDADLKYYKKHQDAFQNFSVSEYEMDAFHSFESSIENCRRADGQNTHFYEIHNDGIKVGELLLTKVVDDEDDHNIRDMGWEVDIAIYDAYQKQGYGREAIKQLSEIKSLNTLFACVNFHNPIKGKIECMLKSLGFVFDGDYSGYWIKQIKSK